LGSSSLGFARPNNADGKSEPNIFSQMVVVFMVIYHGTTRKEQQIQAFDFGTMCNSRPPELYSEFSGGNGTEPIDEI